MRTSPVPPVRRVAALVALAVALIAPLSAHAHSSGDAQERGAEALRSLDYPWRDLGYSVRFRDYDGGTLGTTNSRTKQITVYVKHGQSRQSLRVTVAHELGHALDFGHATAARRKDYRSIRRISQDARWYPCDGCSDYASHAGDWAEVFAYWLAGPGDFRSRVAGPPDRDQLRRLAPLFRVPREQDQPSPGPSPKPSPKPSPSPTGLFGLLPPPPEISR